MINVGNTPLKKIFKLPAKYNISAEIFAKVESSNPAGSTKDRVAYQMLKDAKESGLLKKDSVIIEPTSGNTGIGLAYIASLDGYKTIIVMPSNMSKQRIALIESYGAEVVLTDANQGMQGSIDKAKEISRTFDNAFIPGQFENPSNWKAHYFTTGPEIWKDTDGNIDVFVAGVGTGGTITGVGKFLKEKNSSIKIVAVEPASSAVLSGKSPGMHAIQGIGAGFIPDVLDMDIVDDIYLSKDEDAIKFAKDINLVEGISAGISSGAALDASIRYSLDNPKIKNIVTLFPDGSNRYNFC